MPNYEIYPGNTAGGAKRWIENRIKPGDFLTAVIENNLAEALGRADEDNRAAIFKIVSWWYNEAPSPCWGSPEKVKAWAKGPVIEKEAPDETP
jgi:hypothetical protein